VPAPAVALAGAALRNPRKARRMLFVVLAVLGLWFVLLIGVFGAMFGLQPLQRGYGPSKLAGAEIPLRYLQLYQQAGERYGVDPWILARSARSRPATAPRARRACARA
jgi:amino acid transporter